MKAHLSISYENWSGRPQKPHPNIGQVVVAVDYDGTSARQLWVDSLHRSSGHMERRARSLVNVYDYKGVPVFSGTYDEMVDLIKAGKQSKILSDARKEAKR